MAYITPKTNWVGGVDAPSPEDFNRIELNIGILGNLRILPVAAGTDTAITVATDYFELEDGHAAAFIAKYSNSGSATTINIDGTGAKPIYKPGTTSAPIIMAGKAISVWYNETSDCFYIGSQYYEAEVFTAIVGMSWSGVSAPYTISVSISGILASAANYILDLAMTATSAEKVAWDAANIKATVQGTNSITLTAYGIKPVINLPIQLVKV